MDIEEKIGQCEFEAQYIVHPFSARVDLIVVCKRHGEVAQPPKEKGEK